VTPLSIGLIADTTVQLHTLSQIVEVCGQKVVFSSVVQEDIASQLGNLAAPVQAWLVDVSDATLCWSDGWLETWLEQVNEPIVFSGGDCPVAGSAQFPDWSRRMCNKMQHLSGAVNLAEQQLSDLLSDRIDSIWVLAASTGGPAAVKTFLSQLPPQLGVAFIYVQHIDKEFGQTLVQVLSKNSHYPAYSVEHGSLLKNDSVAVIAAEYWTELQANGTFVMKNEGWAGCYSPSIDQIVANVARTVGSRGNVIIFSGMESDGAISSRLIKQQGGQVWVQSPQSCISSSMPESALAAGQVDETATPEALAEKFIRYRAEQIKINTLNESYKK